MLLQAWRRAAGKSHPGHLLPLRAIRRISSSPKRRSPRPPREPSNERSPFSGGSRLSSLTQYYGEGATPARAEVKTQALFEDRWRKKGRRKGNASFSTSARRGFLQACLKAIMGEYMNKKTATTDPWIAGTLRALRRASESLAFGEGYRHAVLGHAERAHRQSQSRCQG